MAAIASPICSMVIKCSFITKDWEFIGPIYTCQITAIVNPEIPEVIIRGTHSSPNTDADVEGLFKSNELPVKGVEAFPKIHTVFPNLKCLRVQNIGLTSITSTDLEALPQLELFSVAHNSLETIKGDLFRYTPKLISISFESNVVKFVGPGLLSKLENLQKVNFLNNSCINVLGSSKDDIIELQVQLTRNCGCSRIIDEAGNLLDLAEDLRSRLGQAWKDVKFVRLSTEASSTTTSKENM